MKNESQDIEKLRDLISVARGHRPADLVLKNLRVVNVFTGEIIPAGVALYRGRIAGVGEYRGEQEIDLGGAYLAPGFIDGHVHVESSKLTPLEYASAVVPRGTTSIVIDPHEIANVFGPKGIQFMLDWSEGLPLSMYFMLPSCVPATNLETSGAQLSASDLGPFLRHERVLGIAELMNYPGLLAGDDEVLKKLQLAMEGLVDGHAPGLSGKDLCAYIAAGVRSDHECTTEEEAKEKLRLGMHVMIREGSAAKNLAAIIPAVKPHDSRRFLFATDDRSPEDLMTEGHLDHMARKAIGMGLDPVTAIQIATVNIASYFRLEGLGAIAPGYRADMVVLDDLRKVRVTKVFKAGKLVAQDGRLLRHPRTRVEKPPCSINVDWSGLSGLRLRAQSNLIKVMELMPGQIVNRLRVEKAKVRDNEVVSDLDRDVIKLAVIERHRASGNVGVGFVRGFGLKRGALGSSVAHDSHNIIALGTSDEEIEMAVHEVARMGGGQVVVQGGKSLGGLPLPIAGLMSDQPLDTVVANEGDLKMAARSLGCRLDEPFMALSFLALPVVPELRLTDRGLVDVNRFTLVSLFGPD